MNLLSDAKPKTLHCPLVAGCSKSHHEDIYSRQVELELDGFISRGEAWVNLSELARRLLLPGSVSRFQGCKLQLQLTSPAPYGTGKK